VRNEDKPLILVTNDDGYRAKGITALIEAVKPFGNLIVVAPSEAHSGMSHAITVKVPLRLEKLEEKEGLSIYICSGTPVDCVKIAMNQLLKTKPTLLVSGINHGANSSSSVVYSGTMAAAIEGCLYEVPSIGFSLLDFSKDADFTPAIPAVRKIVDNVLTNGIVSGTCLNVNIPNVPEKEIKGIRVCRQNKGVWREEFDKRTDPNNREYYWLTGEFYNLEPEAEDTDEWALHHKYISIVPVQTDLTSYESMEKLKQWKL
jgi:5'-nucleotidase